MNSGAILPKPERATEKARSKRRAILLWRLLEPFSRNEASSYVQTTHSTPHVTRALRIIKGLRASLLMMA